MKAAISQSAMKYRAFRFKRPVPGPIFQLVAWTLLFLALQALASMTALANMANPVKAGNALGEPSVDLKSIRIERETLTIDLRPLASGSPAMVEAIYRVRNDGDERKLDLIFVANAMTVEGGGVWLDDQSVPSQRSYAQALPESWKPPQTTPAIDGGNPLSYEARREGTMAFTLMLAPGQHLIRVRYQAQATAHSTDQSPNVYWQLGYVLSPARQWAAFGGLDAKILLPTGWNAASNPSMKREGDTLIASWEALPGDTLSLTVQSPPGNQAFYTVLRLIVFFFGLIICLALGWLLGSWLGGRRRTSAWALPLSLVSAFIWGLSFFIAWAAMLDSIKGKAGSQASWIYGYGDIFISMFYFILMVPLGLILTQLMAFIASRRARARAA
jgi:hypothetical protein